ncbi:MAG: RNA polymerase sigma factor [Planctomycetes bacterium]|nr:RNA polymerase sigma factor [Planctomycetota bacterium]
MGLAARKRAKPEAKQQESKPAPLTGDERFDAYYRQLRLPIFNYVYRLVGNTHVAEEITQEAFVRLYRRIDTIIDSTASAWMYRVARNLVTDHHRKKSPVLFTVLKGKPKDDDEMPSLQFASSADTPEDESYGAELSERLQWILKRMSPKFRDPLVLCDLEKLTYEQAAQVLGCSVKTVAARLHRAREYIAGCLDRFLVDKPNES